MCVLNFKATLSVKNIFGKFRVLAVDAVEFGVVEKNLIIHMNCVICTELRNGRLHNVEKIRFFLRFVTVA